VTRLRAGALLATLGLAVLLVTVTGLTRLASAPAQASASPPPVLAAGSEPRGVIAATAATAAPTPTTAGPRGPLGSGEPVTLAFAGDSHFEAHLRSRLINEGPSMLDSMQPLFAGADLSVLNLETSITDRGSPEPKEWTFRTTPSALDALAGAGIDAVSMANNHGLDFGGGAALDDSLAARAAAPLAVLGIGVDAGDAYRPYLTEVRGQRIAVIAATQVLDEDLIRSWTASDSRPGLASAKTVSRLTATIRATRYFADTVVVYLHWGQERTECPTANQRDLAPRLLEAGADIVVGSHAHRLLGAGRMGDGFVAYGLGNFIWFNEAGPNGDTGVLLVTATGRRIDGYEWRAARIRNGVPVPLEGEARDEASAHWDGLRACTDLAP
jgi:hypothetical protein